MKHSEIKKMKELQNENLTIQKAVRGDYAALTELKEHLQSMTRSWGADHARIEAKRVSLVALAYAKSDQVDVLDRLQENMILETDK